MPATTAREAKASLSIDAGAKKEPLFRYLPAASGMFEKAVLARTSSRTSTADSAGMGGLLNIRRNMAATTSVSD